MTKVVCTECRHENEPERIYCHECGARLGRSGPADPAAAGGDTDAETQRRLKKMMDPNQARVRLTVTKFIKIVLGAAASALVLQLILPPDGVPPKQKNELLPPQINMDLESAAIAHRPAELSYTEQNANAYLAYSLRTQKASFGSIFPLERVFVGFDEGTCRINVERSLLGYSLYGSSSYWVRIDGGKISTSNLGGQLGRVPIHPAIMKYVDAIFYRTWSSLARDRKSVAKMERIEFHPQSVTLFPRMH